MGNLSLLQGIFPTQGSNPGLQHCRHILYQLSHKGSPRILEWVAYPFSSGSSWPRNWTRVSCIADGILSSWPTREAHNSKYNYFNFLYYEIAFQFFLIECFLSFIIYYGCAEVKPSMKYLNIWYSYFKDFIASYCLP